MRTAYLIKSHAQSVDFDCRPKLGLTFVTSAIDLTFLDNVVLNGDLKLLVRQEIHDHGVSVPDVWFLIFSEESAGNDGLEMVWKYATQFGSTLYRYTRLGQSFSYKNVWTFPQIPDSWVLEETYVQFDDKGGFNCIYWDDPSQPIHEQDGEEGRKVTGKTVNADHVTVITNDKNLTQSHFTHVCMPGNVNVDTGPFHQTKEVLELITKHGFDYPSETHFYLLQLYNRAISSEDIFSSYILFYQMIEVLIRFADGQTLSVSEIEGLKTFVKGDEKLAPYYDRLVSSVSNITKETSRELLLSGVSKIVGEDKASGLDINAFKSWRLLRGDLTHPKKARALTEQHFVETYRSLRAFCSGLVQAFFD